MEVLCRILQSKKVSESLSGQFYGAGSVLPQAIGKMNFHSQFGWLNDVQLTINFKRTCQMHVSSWWKSRVHFFTHKIPPNHCFGSVHGPNWWHLSSAASSLVTTSALAIVPTASTTSTCTPPKHTHLDPYTIINIIPNTNLTPSNIKFSNNIFNPWPCPSLVTATISNGCCCSCY